MYLEKGQEGGEMKTENEGEKEWRTEGKGVVENWK